MRRAELARRLALIGLSVLIGPIGPAYGQASAPEPRLRWGECPPIRDAASAAAMDCGWLVSGARLRGQSVRLRVVVLRARPDRHDPSPVIFIPGGPGDSAGLGAARLARWRQWQQQAGWRHDIVLFDPRGTGESRPRIRCDMPVATPYRVPRQTGSRGDAADPDTQAPSRCLAQLGRVTMQRLGPRAQLRDLEALVEALAPERVHLWAVSYGTRIAQLFAQRHPVRVAGVVLDSPLPFSRNAFRALPRQMVGAIERLEAACARPDARCASTRVRRALAALLARYAQTPVRVSVAAYPQASGRVEVTPRRLLIMLVLAGTHSGHEADTVARLERALRGDPSALAPLAARWVALDGDRDRSDAMFWSTRCALVGPQRVDAWPRLRGDMAFIAPYVSNPGESALCRDWPGRRIAVPAPDASFDMPILVVAGRDDVATPPAWARAFVARHPGARIALIAGVAHAPTLFNACAQRAVARFMRDPAGPGAPCAGPRLPHSGR